jgi:hypothetical protein
MSAQTDFTPVFAGLRAILAEHAPKLKVMHDRPGYYYLDTYTIGSNKKPIFFGGVKTGKNYVSYYLMCVYGTEGSMLADMSPELKKHMQGKACFNFKTVDEELFKELKKITKRGYQAWKKMEWVD